MLKVPVDHKIFKELNPQQAQWYNWQFSLDDEEKFNFNLNMTEYLASFSNPEAVQKIQEARENTYNVPDDDFNTLLKEQFGRDITNSEDVKELSPEELMEIIRENNQKDEETESDFLDMNLDDVKFTPFT